MVIEHSPEVWRYQLTQDAVGSASMSLDRPSFITLLERFEGLSLGDVVAVPKLRFRIAPHVSDQETTFDEFQKLCRLDLPR